MNLSDQTYFDDNLTSSRSSSLHHSFSYIPIITSTLTNTTLTNTTLTTPTPINSPLIYTTFKNTSTFQKMFRYHDPSYRIVGTIIMVIIFLVGVIGNIMVILVVLKSKNMKSPTNCYLVSLAFADLLLLLSATLPTIVEFHLIQDEFVAGSIACRAMVFSQYLGFNLSSLSITALTAERYVAICQPMKAHAICTINRAKKIISALWLFGFCYSAPWLGLITTRETYDNIEECTFTLSRDQYMIYYLTDLVVMYFIPVIVNVILYSLISKTLYYSNPISIAFGGGSSNTFGVVAATASICRGNTSCDDDSKAGSYKGSSINSSFRSCRNNENRSLIRKKFANESIKSFTLYRHESRSKKQTGNLKKRFWKRDNSKNKDSCDSNRICEGVEEDENLPSVKEDTNKTTEPNEHIQLEKEPKEKSTEIQNVENEFELHDVAVKAKEIADSNAKNDFPLKRQLKRQATLFHETLNQKDNSGQVEATNAIEDNRLDTQDNTTIVSESTKSNFKFEKSTSDLSNKFPQKNSTMSRETTTKTPPMKFNISHPSTKSTTTTNSSIRSRRGRYSGFTGSSQNRKTTKASLMSNMNSRSRAMTFMASSLSSASTYGANPIQSRTQIIKMLVVVVSLFAVLWLPYRVFVVYNSFKKPRFEDVWLMLACRTMVHANSAINPILYNAMSVKFKKAFKNLLRCGKKPSTNVTNRRGAVDCNLNYSRKDIFFNMYEKNYRDIIQDRVKALKT